MQTGANTHQDRKRVRQARWARLWLVCIAAILNWREGAESAACVRRRAKIGDLPQAWLARLVAMLISICTAPPEQRAKHTWRPHVAAAHLRRANPRAHFIRAHLRAVLTKLRLRNASRSAIARLCANPERAIARLNAFFQRGLTRRRAIIFAEDVAALFASAAAPAPQSADSS